MYEWLVPMALSIIFQLLKTVIKNPNARADYEKAMLKVFLTIDQTYPEFREQLP